MAESEKRAAPTYEEFREAVKREFLEHWKIEKECAAIYFESEEATQVIKEEYYTDLQAYSAGEISYNVFMTGGVAAASCCLELMYE